MKRRIFKNARYSAIVIAGALLAATPMTALAEKSADAAQVEVAAEDTQTEGEGSADTTDTADSKDTTDAGKDTADKTTEDKTTEDKTTDKETESSETSADKTEESKDTETETEKETTEAEETTADAAETETSAEETTAAETTVAETTVAETTAAAQLKEKTLAQLLIGTWKADETTSLTFGESGKGKMSFAKDDYAFTYKLEDDELSLDFSSNKVIDCSYTISVTEDTLTLVGGAGTTGGTFDLTKNAD